ncbi:MAG: amidohydrolase family protein, partial [Planctomycetota bacterium]
MPADLRIENARIWTGDPARPRASTLLVQNGRILAMDEDGPADVEIDARGRSVCPGLVDAHVHLLLGGQALEQLDLSGVRSRQAFEDAIAARHADLPADRWLIARSWSNQNWPSGELPDRTWLAAAGARPAVCHRSDLHAVLVNDAVLAMLDCAHDPPGGRIVRDAAGDPTGVLLEAGAWKLVNPLIPSPDLEARRAALQAAQAHCHARGLTMVGSMEYIRDLDEVFVPARDQLTLRTRITLLDRGWPMQFDRGRDFENDERLAVIGYKAFLDGTFGSGTARMLAEYA